MVEGGDMAVAVGSFETYYQTLRARFSGKDAARLPVRLKGTITFLFRESGAVADRMTLRFTDEGVQVDAATRLHEGEPTAIVRCALAAQKPSPLHARLASRVAH